MQASAISNKRQETSKSPSTSSGHATSMAELMKRTQTQAPLVSPHKGDILKGTITQLEPEVLVDINAKTEAVVLEKDRNILRKILSTFQVGSNVSVQVLNPESDLGHPVVSLRRSIEALTWEKLAALKKDQTVLDVVVDSETKGGFLVTTSDGISGFLPHSHTSSLDNPQSLIGQKIKVVVLEQNQSLGKILFSQKQVLSLSDFTKLTKTLKVGQKTEATIIHVIPFGLTVSLVISGKTMEGFIHISELAWEQDQNILEKFKEGDKIEAFVLGFDQDGRRVNLSIKRLTEDPIEKRLEEFAVDKKLKATVVKVIATGVLLNLNGGVSGIIKKEKVPPKMTFEEGAEIEVLVSEVDEKRHRVVVVPVLKEKPIGYR